MGFLLDQLKAKLKKRQDSNSDNVAKQFKRIPKKDITFISAESTPDGITNYVNTRMQELISQCGGIDRFVDGDFSVKYVDRSTKRDEVKVTEIELAEKKAQESGSYDLYDWEGQKHVQTTQLKEGLEDSDVRFYMVIIEYTQILEIQ